MQVSLFSKLVILFALYCISNLSKKKYLTINKIRNAEKAKQI